LLWEKIMTQPHKRNSAAYNEIYAATDVITVRMSKPDRRALNKVLAANLEACEGLSLNELACALLRLGTDYPDLVQKAVADWRELRKTRVLELENGTHVIPTTDHRQPDCESDTAEAGPGQDQAAGGGPAGEFVRAVIPNEIPHFNNEKS
jgi:hypothetical protein